MPSGLWPRVLTVALNRMNVVEPGPLGFLACLMDGFKDIGRAECAEEAATLAEAVLSEDPNDGLRQQFSIQLRRWDHATAPWAEATQPHTTERRVRMFALLAMPEPWSSRCDTLIPPRLNQERSLVIARPRPEWYSSERTTGKQFFWDHYSQYLRNTRRWPEASIEDLDRDAASAVAHIWDPVADTIQPTRGLVVGYVQSGKTAHFTGLIAKAVDAGYRFVIVLAGTWDLLRNQTQRRIDRELVGKELIRDNPDESGRHDYVEDIDWDDFQEYGDRPSRLGACDWQRLTTAHFDYESLKAGIDVLEFEPGAPGRRYNDPQLISREKVRLIILKKIPPIVRRLTKDLRRLRADLREVPTLIIDDESDLASISTLRPKRHKEEQQRRTKTNEAINTLLALIPGAQYVGYTATPAATVLMDKDDTLFPKDFILPLPRPTGYMGVADFCDGDDLDEDARYRKQCFVREINGPAEDDRSLLEALDRFVLAGAIKCYREAAGSREYIHHTMLVHESRLTSGHSATRDRLLEAFKRDRFVGDDGLKRLRDCLATDFLATDRVLQGTDQSQSVGLYPPAEEIGGLLDQFWERVHRHRVLVANAEVSNRERAPDFDSEPIWAVIVGGDKLSRGYTVEGLTISYYRRPAGAADTLMQMGRWFGFRPGYRDLVRVFLSVEERKNKPPLELYEEFKALAFDEERFRSQLRRYAALGPDHVRPEDVPPLVFSSGDLLPTSRNKMFHARRAVENWKSQMVERTMMPSKPADITANWESLELLLATSGASYTCDIAVSKREKPYRFTALSMQLQPQAVLRFLEDFRWSRQGGFQSIIDYIKGDALGDPGIRQWLLLHPLMAEAPTYGRKTCGPLTLDVRHRARVDEAGHRYKVFSEPPHVAASEWLTGNASVEDVGSRGVEISGAGIAVLTIYGVRDSDEANANLGFFIQFPDNDLPEAVAFVTGKAESA